MHALLAQAVLDQLLAEAAQLHMTPGRRVLRRILHHRVQRMMHPLLATKLHMTPSRRRFRRFLRQLLHHRLRLQ